ncbi:XrtB/PEP-CTERM-associated polysaccharide biosynthesis outer membrane protein EpsL [Methyloversatilis thermotolerans]|uniref:XrtB/PEP-CTERM-associated polysaccharide biosynthesis outer membrane protein EpsL n=1 Tax=Methyloversatilis thermotolerans TaxID=1346290 RepID=UPI000362895D|nr:XrtB/PEP-CTERM-associated polysaccharide biosynthesis outer membrane protein EpsL [Methyloversatilis thermotolerans]
MNNNTQKSRSLLCLLCLLPLSAVVKADENDAFGLITSASWQYVDNVLYLPDGQRSTAFGPDTPRGDHSYTASAGLTFQKRISRQELSASYVQNMVRYNAITDLDYDGYNAAAGWKWEIGNNLSGQLRYTSRRYLQGFGDFRTTNPAKNLVNAESYRFDANYRINPYWALFGGVSRDTFENGLTVRRASDYEIDRAEFGGRYTTRGGTAFELLVRDSDGDYPNRLPSLNVTNSYTQKDIEARVRWQPVGHSRLSASIGQSDRKHANVPARDYQDVYGRMSWDWQPTGHLQLTVSAERQIAALEDTFSSYFRTTTYTLAPSWQPTAKLRFDGRVQRVSRDGSGQTAFTELLPQLAQNARQEDITIVSIGATWSIQRNLSLSAELRRDERDSNSAFYQYKVNSASATVQYQF